MIINKQTFTTRVKISPQMGRNQGRLHGHVVGFIWWEAGGHKGAPPGLAPGGAPLLLGLQRQDGQQQLLRSHLHKPGWTLKVRVLRGSTSFGMTYGVHMSSGEWHQCSAQSFELHPDSRDNKHRFKGPPDLRVPAWLKICTMAPGPSTGSDGF